MFSSKCFCTSGVSFHGLEAIRTKFVGQPEERATVCYYDFISCILVRGLIESLGLHNKKL